MNGKCHFVFVTNLVPCSGVRLHLWPEKGNSASDLPLTKRVLEVTSKMVKIPSGPAPRQVLNVHAKAKDLFVAASCAMVFLLKIFCFFIG